MKKTIFYTALSLVTVFGVLFYFSSCKPNPCVTRAVECKNGGVCREGECICALGYEGDSCQFQVNEKFASYYACIRTRLTNGTIVDDNDDTIRVKTINDRFTIQFFSIRDSIHEVIKGTVNGNYITIPTQQGDANTLFSVYSGNGSLNNGVITITLFRSWDFGGPMSSKTTYVGYKY